MKFIVLAESLSKPVKLDQVNGKLNKIAEEEAPVPAQVPAKEAVPAPVPIEESIDEDKRRSKILDLSSQITEIKAEIKNLKEKTTELDAILFDTCDSLLDKVVQKLLNLVNGSQIVPVEAPKVVEGGIEPPKISNNVV